MSSHSDDITGRLLLTPEQAAEVLSIGRTRLYQLVATGQLPSVKLGASRRITRQSLERYVASLEQPAQAVTAMGQNGSARPRPPRPRRHCVDDAAFRLPLDC
jgi:excisionase family DNA binding protein